MRAVFSLAFHVCAHIGEMVSPNGEPKHEILAQNTATRAREVSVAFMFIKQHKGMHQRRESCKGQVQMSDPLQCSETMLRQEIRAACSSAAEVASSPPPQHAYLRMNRSQLNVCVSFSDLSDLTNLLCYSTEDLGVGSTALLNSSSQPVTWQKTHRNQPNGLVNISEPSHHNNPSELLNGGLGSMFH